MRLMIELINALAFRRSDDMICVGPSNTHAGFLDDGRGARFLENTQFKSRGRHASRMDTPIPADVLAATKATPTVGIKMRLVDGRGKPFKQWAFNHGLRERSLSPVCLHAARPAQAVLAATLLISAGILSGYDRSHVEKG